MSHRARRRLAAAAALVTALGLSLAASLASPDPAAASTREGRQGLALAKQLYGEARFDQAAEQLESALVQGSLTDDDLLAARELLGRVYYRAGKAAKSQAMFRALLQEFPDWRLDPVHVPPEEVRAFEQAREKFEAERGASRAATGSPGVSAPAVPAAPAASAYPVGGSGDRDRWSGGAARTAGGPAPGGRRGTIGLNPVGLVLEGLSFLEYTRPIAGATSLTVRLDHVRWSDEEEEIEGYTDVYRTTYEETGSGFGAGIGLRTAFGNPAGASFVVGGGLDVVSASWEWKEQSYTAWGSPSYGGEGSGDTFALAYHGGVGGRFMLGRSGLFLEPQLLFGSMSIEVESSSGYGSGVGFFVGPSVTIGMALR